MTTPRKIRVLYFDESAESLGRFLDRCGSKDIIEMIGAFRSFAEIASLLEEDAFRFLALLNPDVIVLRFSEPNDSARAWLQTLKKHCPAKTVGLLSSACIRDARMRGALDYCTEAASPENLITDEDAYTHLIYQIKTARLALNTERAGVHGKWAILPVPPRQPDTRRFRLIAMGASAGGTEAVTKVLSALPTGLPPILVVQHIPDNFTAFFAKNLAAKVAMTVAVARDGEKLENGTVYIAGDDKHLEIARNECGEFVAKCSPGEKISGHRPSVDALFLSVAKTAEASAIGVILTGMGSDGAQGLLEMRKAGAYTIGQDQATCAVYGMPMVAYALGAVSKQLPLDAIAKAILSAVSSGEGKDARA